MESPQDIKSPSPRWLRWIIGATGLVASAAIWWYAHSVETKIAEARFRADAIVRIESIEHELTSVTTAIEDIAGFLSVIRDDVHHYFPTIAQSLIERKSTLQALSWNRIVPGDDRARYESEIRARGIPDFKIMHRDESGVLRPAPPAAEYTVVEVILPIKGNENAVGFDVASEVRRRIALETAREKGTVIATAPITLVQETENQAGLLVFAPVNRRPDGVIGFVVGVLRMGDAISTALSAFPGESMGILIQETAATDSERTLFQREIEPVRNIDPVRTYIEYAGRTWLIQLDPGQQYAPRNLQPQLLGSGAAAFVLLFLLWAAFADKRNLALREVIAQREFADTARAKSEERFRLMVDSISDGGWDLNLSDDVVIVSDGWLSGLGYEETEAPKNLSDWMGLIHPDDRDVGHHDFVRRFEEHGGLYDETMRLRHRDGSYRWYRRRARVIDSKQDGRPMRVIGMDVDVTIERRQRELQEKLERKVFDTQKTDSLVVLAGGIAHDFNNLLVGVLGAAELALSQDPPSKFALQLERIRDSAIRAVDLTRQMLIYAGRSEGKFEPADAAEIISNMKKVMESSIGNRQVLHLEMPDAPVVIQCDPTQIRQLILNLVVNASEAMGDAHGKIRVQVQEVTLASNDIENINSVVELKPGSYLRLDVVDSGAGFDPEIKERAFDPFFSTKDAGRGLGLASVLGIVRRHDGGIEVRSNETGGATVRVWLPRSDGSPIGAENRWFPAAPDSIPGDATILVIDDEKIVRNFLNSALTMKGYTVLNATSGSEGIEIIDNQGQSISLVLLDFNMPGMTGLQTFRKIRERDKTLPVILMSGFTPERLEYGRDSEGFEGFLQKPFGPDELFKIVRESVRS